VATQLLVLCRYCLWHKHRRYSWIHRTNSKLATHHMLPYHKYWRSNLRICNNNRRKNCDKSDFFEMALSPPRGGTFTSCLRSIVTLLLDQTLSVNALLILGTTYRAMLILVLLLVLFTLLNSLICLTTWDVFRSEFYTSLGYQCL